MIKPNAVIFDFDGVTATSRFYLTKDNLYPDIQDFVQNYIFAGKEKYGERWMRGDLTYKDINNIIAAGTNRPEAQVHDCLIRSIREFRINPIITEFSLKLKSSAIPHALVTSNMDIFNDFSVRYFHLDKYFPLIFNSADYKMLKRENNGKLYDIAVNTMGIQSYKNVLLIDDSEKSCELIRSKGGVAYQYQSDEDFLEWVKSNLLIV